MAKITIGTNDLVLFEGIAKSGKRIGQPYKFIKLDRRLANNETFVEACRKAGVRILGGQQTTQAASADFEVCQD